MIFINLCYILICVGVSKILTFYSFEFSILTNLPQASIQTGLVLGTWGGMLGKFICSYFINKFKYSHILFFSFLGITLCFILEFMGLLKLTLPIFYSLRTLQGFIAGILYSTILANLGEFYKLEKYEKLITILTGGLSLAGTFYLVLYIFVPFKEMVRYMFFVPVIGAIASLFLVKNRINDNPKFQDAKNKKNIIYYLNILKNNPSLMVFSISFAFSLISSLLILTNFSRLVIVKLNYEHMSGPFIRFLGTLPIILSTGFYFIKKNRSNLLNIFIIFIILGFVNFFFKNLYFYMIFFCLSYSLHLILLPHSSSLILSYQTKDRDYFSYIIHALRAFFYAILIQIFFTKTYFKSLEEFQIFCLIIHLISIILYFIGVFLLRRENSQ